MPTDSSSVYALPAPTLNDPWGLGGQRIRELRDKLEQELTFPHSSAAASAAQSIPNAAYTTLTWSDKAGDREGAMNVATGKYTVPRAGFYLVAGTVLFDANGTGLRYLALFLNNGQRLTNYVPGVSATKTLVTLTTGLNLTAGAVLDLRVYQNSGAALNTAASSSDFTVAMLGR